MVSTKLVLGLLVTGILATATPAIAAPLAAYDLVGTDPEGDAKNMILPGRDETPDTLGRGKQDIIGLQMGTDATNVHFKMNLLGNYIGTSSLLFVVFFKAADTSYFTCWNIQSAGPTSNSVDVQEDLSQMSCSRFTSVGTRVGPTTRANGVEVAQDDAGFFVRWEVPSSSIGDATSVTDIVAETWNRGANVDYVPATSPQSAYVWNQADRAPDAGVWAYAAGGAATPLSLSFSLDPKNATVAPGGTASAVLMPMLTGNGSAAFNWTVTGLPTGWNATFDPANGTLTSGENVTHNLTVLVPEDATNQTVNLTVVLDAGNNITASANLTLIVDETLAGLTPSSSAAPSSSSAVTDNATAASEEAGGIPSIGALVVAVSVVAMAAVIRSRRRA